MLQSASSSRNSLYDRSPSPSVSPRLERVRVVAADGLDTLDLEAGHLELLDVPEERRRRVGAGEDVPRHEEAPLGVLPVGALAQARDLHVEEAVVLEHVAA